MNEKELKILSALRENSRLSLTKLSRATKIPVSTIYDKLRTFNGTVIKKNTALIDFSKLGYNTRANVLLKVNREKRLEMQAYLITSRHANSLYKVNNGYDFLVEFIFRHIKDLEDFLEELDDKFGLESRQVFFIVDDLKRESFLSAPHHFGLLGSPSLVSSKTP